MSHIAELDKYIDRMTSLSHISIYSRDINNKVTTSFNNSLNASSSHTFSYSANATPSSSVRGVSKVGRIPASPANPNPNSNPNLTSSSLQLKGGYSGMTPNSVGIFAISRDTKGHLDSETSIKPSNNAVNMDSAIATSPHRRSASKIMYDLADSTFHELDESTVSRKIGFPATSIQSRASSIASDLDECLESLRRAEGHRHKELKKLVSLLHIDDEIENYDVFSSAELADLSEYYAKRERQIVERNVAVFGPDREVSLSPKRVPLKAKSSAYDSEGAASEIAVLHRRYKDTFYADNVACEDDLESDLLGSLGEDFLTGRVRRSAAKSKGSNRSDAADDQDEVVLDSHDPNFTYATDISNSTMVSDMETALQFSQNTLNEAAIERSDRLSKIGSSIRELKRIVEFPCDGRNIGVGVTAASTIISSSELLGGMVSYKSSAFGDIAATDKPTANLDIRSSIETMSSIAAGELTLEPDSFLHTDFHTIESQLSADTPSRASLAAVADVAARAQRGYRSVRSSRYVVATDGEEMRGLPPLPVPLMARRIKRG